MKPRKRGKKFEISYRCTGYDKPFYERFDTLQEAALRCAQIEDAKQQGVFVPPTVRYSNRATAKPITIQELMEEYVRLYGAKMWGDSYYSDSLHRINHYINPYIGHLDIQGVTTHDLDLYYQDLLTKPAVSLKGRENPNQMISPSVIQKIHALLRSAFRQATRWGYITRNPATDSILPKYESNARAVWSGSEAHYAISICEDPTLKLCMLLAIGCSMRIGEILGLTWEYVDITDENRKDGTANLRVVQELKRCRIETLAELAKNKRDTINFEFPKVTAKEKQTTCLVLKSPKTESSVRTIYIPETVAQELALARQRQQNEKALLGVEYTDYDLVIAQSNGRPYEEHTIATLLKQFIVRHNLRPIVFHSLRHCSASLKLSIGGGNIKAVQGDTGHAQSKMITDLYAHTHDEDRIALAMQMEKKFFTGDQTAPASANPALEDIVQLLQKSPELGDAIQAFCKALTGKNP